jgi:carboxypeptidase Taq
VHWGGNVGFGYFPTYALGTAYAAQFDAAMRRELNVDGLIRENRIDTINTWLKDKIHFSCGMKTPEQILREVTGEAFDVRYYLDFLKNKYTQIYFS